MPSSAALTLIRTHYENIYDSTRRINFTNWEHGTGLTENTSFYESVRDMVCSELENYSKITIETTDLALIFAVVRLIPIKCNIIKNMNVAENETSYWKEIEKFKSYKQTYLSGVTEIVESKDREEGRLDKELDKYRPSETTLDPGYYEEL